jgi:PAS domain S-box-containing protein
LSIDWGSLPYLRETVDAAHGGFVGLDGDGRVVYLNSRANEIFGRTLGDGETIELTELLVGPDYQQAQRVLERLRQGRLPRHWRAEMTALRRDGSEFPIDVSVALGPADSGFAFMAWIEDVSERAELLSELAQALRGGSPGLAEILDSLVEAVTIRDPHHHIIYANQAALRHMGFASLEELQRRQPQSILDEYLVVDERGHRVAMEDIPSVRLLAGKPAEPLIIRTVHRQTGEVKWDMLKSSLLRDHAGHPAATVTVIEDITAERIAHLREHFLSRATDTLMSSLDYEETLSNVAWLAVPEVADWCVVDLLDAGGTRRRVVIAHTNREKLALAEELRRYEQDDGVMRVARSGVAELYGEITDQMLAQGAQDERHLELLREVGFRSVMIAPMRARGRTLGVMTLVTAESLRRFDETDLEFAEQLAGRAAIAVDNARLSTARREIAETLQRSLLPDEVPVIRGWEVATMYRPASASDEVEVGGDFYDFVPTETGWLVLLGDVTGRGVEAAAMTSLVRHGARFLAKHEDGPAAILTRLDEALRERSGLSLCSALCIRLAAGRVIMSSAGHPPPLVIRDDGRIRELGSSGPLLGGWEGSSWEDREVALTPRETLIMYTDGVTDTPGPDGRFGPERLRRFLTENAARPPAALLTGLEAALDAFQVAGQADDTGAVALRPVSVNAGGGPDGTAPLSEQRQASAT